MEQAALAYDRCVPVLACAYKVVENAPLGFLKNRVVRLSAPTQLLLVGELDDIPPAPHQLHSGSSYLACAVARSSCARTSRIFLT